MVNQSQVNKIQKICTESKAKLVAVTKTKSIEELQELYNLNQRVFGENRVQELLSKKDELPQDIEWHLIGHLQTNKVKQIASFISMIHSVDSIKILKEINKQAKNENRIIKCLLQFHVAQEESKYGIQVKNIEEFMTKINDGNFENVAICGIMGMASFVNDKEQVRTEFKELKSIFETLKAQYFQKNSIFNTISMGMSGDYEIALQEGSTMVRVGSLLFR